MKQYPIQEESFDSIVNEPEAMYSTDSQVLNHLYAGNVNWQYVDALKRLSGFTDDIIADWLNVNVKTFRAYKTPDTLLKDNTKEHILLLLSLTKHGIRVFGSAGHFEQWLNTPNYFFQRQAPARYLNTISGIRFTDDRLTAMEYGDNV